MANAREGSEDRNESSNRGRRPRAAVRALIEAVALAEDMAGAVGADRQEREALVQTALAAGEWLADRGRPGRWETLEPAALLEGQSFADLHQASGFLLALGGLIGHAAFGGEIEWGAARRLLLEIKDLSTNPAVSSFAAAAARQLDRAAD
jgi:hypothetical protein